MRRQFTIGQLSELAGVSPKTIRYYESVGVLPPAQRSPARHRMYSAIDIRRLELVRRARALDMGLAEVCRSIRSSGWSWARRPRVLLVGR